MREVWSIIRVVWGVFIWCYVRLNNLGFEKSVVDCYVVLCELRRLDSVMEEGVGFFINDRDMFYCY